MDYVLTVVAQQKGDDHFYPDQRLCHSSSRCPIHTVPCSSALSYTTKLLYAMPEQLRQQSLFNPPKASPCPFTSLSNNKCSYLFRYAAETPVLSPAREAAGWACTAVWLSSCSASSRSIWLSELSIPWCCAPAPRTSSEQRPRSRAAAACTGHTVDPFSFQSKMERKEMEQRVSSQLVHTLH